MLKSTSRAALCVAASAIAISAFAPGTAWAQAEAAPAADDAVATTPIAQPNEIVVVGTGSRLRTKDYQTASPIVSFGSDLLEKQGVTNVTNFLTGLPSLVGSSTSRDNSGDRAGIGYTGLNLLNLRNLGIDRTLVLINGRRQVSGVQGSQAVDINTIPVSLIERVDVLTGGASAIYGADGVTGVVNFVLKKNFEGISAQAQAGISKYGDSGDRFAALTFGRNFAGGRGNVTLAYEFGDSDRLQTRDRPQFTGSRQVGFFRNPDYTPNTPGVYSRIPLNDVRYQWSSRQGAVDVTFEGEPDFRGDGKPYNLGTEIPGGYSRGSDDTLVSDYGNDLLPAITRHVVNLNTRFEVSDALKLFAEAKYATTKSYSLGQPTFDYYIFVPQDNPYIPDTIRAAINPDFGGVLVTRDNFDLGQRGENIKRETFRSVIGAEGELSSSLHYEVSYVFGRTTVTNHFVNDRYTDRFNAALDAVRDPATGQITCRINLDPTAGSAVTFQPGECRPINLFGEGVSDPAGVDFVRASTTERSRITQHVVNASLSGDTKGFFSLPGGPVGFVIGGEYRKESSRFVPDVLEQQGLTFSNQLAISQGEFNVKEVFGELDLPLVRDKPFAYVLDVSGAVRYADYSSTGGATTWKVDAAWAPIRDIRFRGTISQAVRAPNIGELYGAAGQTFTFFDDPCLPSNLGLGKSTRPANCQAVLTAAGLSAAQIANFEDTRTVNISGTTSGNARLQPEKARTWTAGVVLQPSFIRGLAIAVDWYDIKLRQAINTVDAQQLAELCVDQPTIDNPFCGSIVRQQGTGLIVDYTVSPQNVADFRTSGLEVNINYAFKVENVGDFQLKVVGNYLNKLTFVDSPGAEPRSTLGETYQPQYQAFVNLAYQTGPFGFNYSLSWWDKTRRYSADRTNGNPNYVDPQYAWYKQRWVHNISASFSVNKRMEFYGGVNNLFNQQPDIGSITYPTETSGTSFYAGFRAKF
ncbi:TonB-dependent receptor [Novosphingobium sediminis]|uniref:TonB-dependent receptor n=1 Tax=Novosphingobium sediminis TaxID=707214 RepID=A0A512AF10_9SPHN|nr:TonB-dependent receptor [Novosphingobium sediminis]GEN98293.1 TonB-dependent receptor [Novosphingobium sediminis]